MDASALIARLAEPAVADAGLVVDGVSVASSGGRTTVVVTVDLAPDQVGSAGVDAVAAAARGVSAALDDATLPFGAYTLEVGTPGLGRPLTERRHFLRARTRLVSLALLDGAEARGRLADVTASGVVLETPDGAIEIPLDAIREGRVEVEMRRAE